MLRVVTLRLRSAYLLRSRLETADPLDLDLGGADRERVAVEHVDVSGESVRVLVVESTLDAPPLEEILIEDAPGTLEQRRALGDQLAARHHAIANRTWRFLRWRLNLADEPGPL